ncbi:MAG: hypothetical protein KI791_16845 [Cyclobacteriaceae bacterium]|nr:hypothetical protein [Cyclobacteriaceae bacterium SS2]
MFTEQIIQLIFDGLRTIAIGSAAIVGILGINSWRRETRWKRKYQLAEEVLALAYEAKEQIAWIRNGFSYGSEGTTRQKRDKESEEESQIRDSVYVTVERAESVKETFNKLQSLKFRFVAVFDQPDSRLIDEFLKVRNKLIFSSYRLADARVRNRRKSILSEQEQKHIDRLEAIIWSDLEEPDEISKQIDNALEELENICKSVIRKSA